MDALTAAFVAAILAQASDRTPWATAILATRFGKPGAVIAGAAAALAIGNAVAAILGFVIGPRLAPNAQALLLALALLSAGGTALFPIKPPNTLAGWRTGPFLTSLCGVAILGLGDRAQFITAALAVRSSPVLAAIGGLLGSLAVNIPAILQGEPARKRLPIAAVRIASGVIFLIAGSISGLSALRLI